ncbi:RNA polymerase sigma factor [Filimonas effusa]|uniref:Sigma-70 family RNA polymerase sigma factor n=1 Tax=Filimonas effusa TaxID=2508721 RepID=A0A4Q1DEB6_9BACT|nr:sigma-70 family RNA polymerase sigma factor [Filimonas effusa]RXK87245.1 sigma-70 family RNA polymerase sigma factor [Filimonas effusa]
MATVRHMATASFRSDEELLTAFRDTGEQDVLATLYLRYTDLVYGTCLKYLKDAEASKDAVMNIYQELVRKLPLHEVDNFKGWLYVLTKNHCLMQLRKEKSNIMVPLESNFMQSEDFSHLDNVLDREQNFKKLENCLERLPSNQQQAVRLFYLESKCYNEITAATGNDWNKVRSLIQNGRRNLKICMESNG